MNRTLAQPRLLGSTVLVLLLAAAALIPARAMAAPEGGEGALPLVVTPAPVDFPKTTVGNHSPTQEVQIRNEGEAVYIEKFAIEGGDGSFGHQGSNCGYLETGQWCSLWLSFSPQSEGEKTATAEIVFMGERGNEAFTLEGSAVVPKLAFSPAEHDFGLAPIYRESLAAEFELVNEGEAAVQTGSFEIAGPGSEAFWTGNSDCWETWLEPGASCSMEVRFSPRERAEYVAELRASANGSTFSATLSGRGGAAVVETPENPVTFAPATVGSDGEVRTVTLTNSGDLPAAFFISVIAGGDAGSFELLEESCSAVELAPAASCSARVRFTPRGAGTRTARLAFFGDGDDGMMVFLQGEGVAPAATLLPGSHEFGLQTAGTRSAAHAFAVRNQGAAALPLDDVRIVGADPDQFVLAGDECTGAVLAPGGECLVRVRFAPDAAGAMAATLRVAGPGGALTATLSGHGEAAAASASGGAVGLSEARIVTIVVPVHAAAAGSEAGHRQRGRHRQRFVRGKAIHGGNARALRRKELRASAARPAKARRANR